MLNKKSLDDILYTLDDPTVDILTKNRIALSVSKTRDKRVLESLHRLIVMKNNANCRGTFVYCLLEFSGVLSFDLAIDLLINGNFEVAHHAFEIIDSINEPLNGERVVKAYKKLTKFVAHNQDIVFWRKSLVNDAIDMFT